MKARLVLCVLHDDPSAIRDLCGTFLGFEYDDEYSGQGHDDRMASAFHVSDNTVRPTLEEQDRESIASHRNVAYVLSPRLDSAHPLFEATRALKFVEQCFQAGARAVKCESSGLTHGRNSWLKLAGAADATSLYCAWVRRPLSDSGVTYSCGMHLLGYPDIEVSGATVTDALGLIDGFAMYLLIDKPGDRLRAGHTFSLSTDSPSCRVTNEACKRYEDNDFFYNPHGYWHLDSL